jgi:hypothetical protein
MIALLTTYLIVAYIFIPGILYRLSAAFFVKLRLFQLTRAQEATFGGFVSLAPFLLALLLVWHVPFARSHPFQIDTGSLQDYRNDHHRAFTLIVAEDPSRFLEPSHGQNSPYALSLSNIEHRQLRFLVWYYCFIALEGALFGYLSRKYGDWSTIGIYEWFARKALLPNISEWQLLLTDFTFPKKPKRDVFADVLCGDRLYRGRVADYFLDRSGALSGVFMKNVERFRKREYETACASPDTASSDKEQFWREIPGANFYIPADKITNLNVHFPYRDITDLETFLLEALKRDGVEAKISVGFDKPTDPDITVQPVQATRSPS